MGSCLDMLTPHSHVDVWGPFVCVYIYNSHLETLCQIPAVALHALADWPSHDQAALVRAVMEGVAFGLKEKLEFSSKGSSANSLEVRLAGGGARSRIRRQIVADVTGHPVRRLECIDASALGAALLAAVGCGIFSDLVEAADQAVVVGELLTPDEKNHGIYQECFASYQDTYKALGQEAPFSL